MKAIWTIANCLILFLCSSSVRAQDVHLSQYYMNDLNLNPAYVGQYEEGDWRFTGNFRSQWAQVNDNALITFMLGGEKKIPIKQSDLGLGLLLIRDQFDEFKTNLHKVLLTSSFGIPLGGTNKIMLGVQAGILHRELNPENNVFGEQWDRSLGAFDPSQDSGEDFGENISEVDIDFNAGIGWRARIKKIEPRLGFNVQHINQPIDSYLDASNEDKIDLRYVGDASLVYYLSPFFQIEPSALYMFTTNTQDLVYGSNFRYVFANNPKHLSIYLGVFNRGDLSADNDAIIPKIGAKIDRLELGASYDYNTSTLSDFVKQKSSIEFAIRYTTGSNKPGIISSPCDIF